MTPRQMHERWRSLRADLAAGRLGAEAFREAAAELRYRDGTGVWHQIDPGHGGWLRWDGTRWAAEAAAAPARPAEAPAPVPVPVGFWALLGRIVRLTIASFFRRLPLTLLIGLGALALHTYLLVGPNGGFDPDRSKWVSGFLSLSNGPLSGIVVWTVASMLIAGLLGRLRRRGGPGLGARLGAVYGYFRHAGKDAAAVLMATVGLSLAAGAVVNAPANLVLAAGVGALLAARAGPVLALLFRSAWQAVFSIARRADMRAYGLAAGYVGFVGSSAGFLLNTAVAPDGAAAGIALMIAALVLVRVGGAGAQVGLWLLAGLAASLLAGEPALLLADDGGLNDPGGTYGGGSGTWASWAQSPGAPIAVLFGVGPALGAAFGPALLNALAGLSGQLPADADGTATAGPGGALIDPDTGEPLTVHDGMSYAGGRAGQVWYDGRWLDADEAGGLIRERQEEIARRQGEIDRFWRDVEQDRDQRLEAQADQLRRDGYRWDPDRQAWVNKPAPAAPPADTRSRLDEYYARGDFLEDNRYSLTPGQQAALDRVLDRIGYRDHGVDPQAVSDEDLDTLRRLSHAVNDLNTGRSEAEGARAEHDAIDAQHRQNVAENMARAGQMAAGVVEAHFVPATRGAITGFVFGGVQHYDQGAGAMVKNGLISAAGNWVDNRIGNARPGDVGWNAMSSGLTAAAETGLRGGNADDMLRAGGYGAATGGLMEGLQNRWQGRGFFDAGDGGRPPARPAAGTAAEPPAAAPGTRTTVPEGPGPLRAQQPDLPAGTGTRAAAMAAGGGEGGLGGGGRFTGPEGGVRRPAGTEPAMPGARPAETGGAPGTGVRAQAGGEPPGGGTRGTPGEGAPGRRGGGEAEPQRTASNGGKGASGGTEAGGDTGRRADGGGGETASGTGRRTDTTGAEPAAQGSSGRPTDADADAETGGSSGTRPADSAEAEAAGDTGRRTDASAEPAPEASSGRPTDADAEAAGGTGRQTDSDAAAQAGGEPDELRPVEGMTHSQRGWSVEEGGLTGGRHFEKDYWVIDKHGNTRPLTATGAADYTPARGEAVISRDRFGQAQTQPWKLGDGVSRQDAQSLIARHADSLPPPKPLPEPARAVDHPDDGRWDAGDSGLTPHQVDTELDDVLRELEGPAARPGAPVKPPGGESGTEVPPDNGKPE